MPMHRKTVEFSTSAEMDIIDLSGDVETFLADAGIGDGLLILFTPGSTAGITTIEYESGCLSDLRRAMEHLAPRGAEYAHNLRWGDGNGYSHVRAALLGPSLAVPIRDGRADTGTWQQLVLCDFDNRPRRRKVTLQAMA
jgi:secondary thiamine-phosphate synthase enzyme